MYLRRKVCDKLLVWKIGKNIPQTMTAFLQRMALWSEKRTVMLWMCRSLYQCKEKQNDRGKSVERN